MTAAGRRALAGVPTLRRVVMTARFGDPGRTTPLTRWGRERGTPVDRWYLERWLHEHARHVHGRALEVKADHYASRLGAAEVEVVDIDRHNPAATIIGDLCDPATLPPGRYDAAVVTQTLQLLHDPASGLRGLLASLRPGGTLLLTVPCLSRVIGPSDLWRWTPAGLQHLIDAVLPDGATAEVVGLGNGLAGRAFLFGLAAEDLWPGALPVGDPDLPLIACAVVRLSA